jgi:hypothetical protein
MGHGSEAIKAEAEAWDLTGLPEVCRMAQRVLLRHDDGLAFLCDLIADGTISSSELGIGRCSDVCAVKANSTTFCRLVQMLNEGSRQRVI